MDSIRPDENETIEVVFDDPHVSVSGTQAEVDKLTALLTKDDHQGCSKDVQQCADCKNEIDHGEDTFDSIEGETLCEYCYRSECADYESEFSN